MLTSLLLLQLTVVFFVSWGGVRLSPLGTSATNWPIVPAPDDRWWEWNSWWNENWQGKPKYLENTFPSATLSTTNPTWPDLGWNPGRRGEKPATSRLSYGTASVNSKSQRRSPDNGKITGRRKRHSSDNSLGKLANVIKSKVPRNNKQENVARTGRQLCEIGKDGRVAMRQCVLW
jgi:hypothetical protein